MIITTRAVVLRELKYRDQSKICLLMTREFGQMPVIVKAVRNPKNRLCGLFSAGNVIDAVIYRRTTRDIQLASDAGLVCSPLAHEPDLERFGVLYRILDLARNASGPEEKNLPLFTLLASTIERLCSTDDDCRQLLAAFLLRLVGVLGFAPSIERCVFSGCDLAASADGMRELFFVHDPGGFALPAATPGAAVAARAVPVERYRILRDIAASGGRAPDVPDEETAAICELLQEYCSRHLERMPHRKHLDIVSRIMTA